MERVSTLTVALAVAFCAAAALASLQEVQQLNGTLTKNDFVFLGSYDGSPGETDKAISSRRSNYFRSTAITQWEGGNQDCRRIFGPSSSLVNIETQEEFNNVTEFMKDETSGTVYWIGGRYNPALASFLWNNDVPVGPWAPWSEGHPDSRVFITRMVYSPITARFQTAYNSQEYRYICEMTEGPPAAVPCYSDNDLIIVVDASGSIGPSNFMMALEFTTKLAVTWADNPGNRVSVIKYSSGSVSVFDLSKKLTVEQIRQVIYDAAYDGGTTASDKALEQARQEFSSNPREVPKNIVFLTDGGSNNPPATASVAATVQEAGIRAFSVGITLNVNEEELLVIAGNKTNHVFQIEEFDKLLELLQPVSVKVCE